jgi:hypothetical protein
MCSRTSSWLRVHRDVAMRAWLGVVGHAQAVLVVGVEHGAVAGDLDDDALDLGELLEVSMPPRPR